MSLYICFYYFNFNGYVVFGLRYFHIQTMQLTHIPQLKNNNSISTKRVAKDSHIEYDNNKRKPGICNKMLINVFLNHLNYYFPSLHHKLCVLTK